MTLGLEYKIIILVFGGARHQFLTRRLSARISSWPVCSGYASVPYAYSQHVLKGLRSVHALVPDAYAQCTHQFLTRMLSARISSWRACSACAWVPDPYAQRAHKGRSMRVKSSIFLVFKVPKTAKILKNRYWHQQMVSKASRKKFFLHKLKKIPP